MKNILKVRVLLITAIITFTYGCKNKTTVVKENVNNYAYGKEAPKVNVGTKPVDFPARNDDGTVTFKLLAPDAKSVGLINTTGGWTTKAWPQGENVPMTKDKDGNWTVTIGPLEPEFYNYAFMVDGVYVLDPINPLVARDGVRYRSELPIKGEKTYNYEYHDVPH